LDLNLKYKTDPSAGSAKFVKEKQELTIKLPVVGLTEDSQKVLDEHYRKHVLEKEEELNKLQEHGAAQEEAGAEEAPVDKRIEQSEGSAGVNTRIVKPMLDDQAGIEDGYSMEKTTDEIRKKMAEEDDDDDNAGMLDVYKEGQEEPELKLPVADLPDTKPSIEELSSVKFDGKGKPKQPVAESREEPAPNAVVFDWETAPRTEAKFTFMNRGDRVFVNYNLKGYDKVDGVRYALSENEILLEVRVPGDVKVQRLC
jgi:hypothetical protein